MPEVGIRYFTYDALNRRSSLKDEVGSVWYFDYDANSNLTNQLNPLAAQSSWGYDGDNRKIFRQDPLARTWYWTYDPAGNASSRKDGRAQVTYYQHDSVNLRHRVDYPDLVSHYFEFDVARQLTAMADPSGRTVESYDNLGRLTLRTNPGSQNLYYEYDATSNRTNLKDPDGKAIYYIYDAANRLEHVEAPDYSGTVAYYQYDLANERTFERKKNGVLSYYYFDNAGRTSAIEHRGSGGIIEGWDYTRDEVGNILLQIRRSDSMRTYWNYNQANRITLEAWRSSGGSNVYGFAYSYDVARNRNRKTNLAGTHIYWNYDAADQLTIQKQDATTTVYFTYDANGNVSVEHDIDAGAGRTYYEYDPRNLLSKIDFPQAIATNYFYYNAPGERIRKDDSTGGKKYTWDRFVPIVEKNLANSTTQRMLKGYRLLPGIGDYLLQDVGGTVIYPHKNQVGTTMRSTDVSQVLKNTYEYDIWGVTFVASETVGQRYRFLGLELDADSVAFNSENSRYSIPGSAYEPFRDAFSNGGMSVPINNEMNGSPQEGPEPPPAIDPFKEGGYTYGLNDAFFGRDRLLQSIVGSEWSGSGYYGSLTWKSFFPPTDTDVNNFYTNIYELSIGRRIRIGEFSYLDLEAKGGVSGDYGGNITITGIHRLTGSHQESYDPLKTGSHLGGGIWTGVEVPTESGSLYLRGGIGSSPLSGTGVGLMGGLRSDIGTIDLEGVFGGIAGLVDIPGLGWLASGVRGVGSALGRPTVSVDVSGGYWRVLSESNMFEQRVNQGSIAFRLGVGVLDFSVEIRSASFEGTSGVDRVAGFGVTFGGAKESTEVPYFPPTWEGTLELMKWQSGQRWNREKENSILELDRICPK